MFRTNTDSKCIFKKFKELTSDDELRVSDTLEQHATGVMNVIDDTIMNIENVDYVFELCIYDCQMTNRVKFMSKYTF
jgi:hypothetical protein